MERPRDLPAALLRRAGDDPEEPWLFHPRGLDWSWRSWGRVAAHVLAIRDELAVLALPPGARVGFHGAPGPDAVAVDLALQVAGLVPVPLPLDGELAAGLRAWVRPRPEEPSPPGLPAVLPPPAPSPFAAESIAPRAPVPRVAEVAGRLAVMEEGGTGIWRDVTQAAVARAAWGLAERLGENLDRSPRRDILVLHRSLGLWGERLLLAWALLTGAAVALEATPGAFAASARWARPTVVHGTPGALAALRAGVPPPAGRRRLAPFGRLRAVLVAGGGELARGERAFWESWGAVVEPLPPAPADVV